VYKAAIRIVKEANINARGDGLSLITQSLIFTPSLKVPVISFKTVPSSLYPIKTPSFLSFFQLPLDVLIKMNVNSVSSHIPLH
jgi:hypothetical protein